MVGSLLSGRISEIGEYGFDSYTRQISRLGLARSGRVGQDQVGLGQVWRAPARQGIFNHLQNQGVDRPGKVGQSSARRGSPGHVQAGQGKGMLTSASAISQFVKLQPSGERLTGLCPFHNDEVSSLVVYPGDRGWYCFGCGRGGGVIQFLIERGMTYSQAKQWCDLREGKIPEPQFTPQFKKKKKAKPSHQVVDYWHSLLGDHREYFHSRLLTDETINKYRLGWTGIRFSIPFWSREPGNSQVVAVQSRRNSGGGPKYRWELGSQPHVFNLGDVKGSGTILVFFSTLDALLARQDGLRAVAAPGQTVGVSSCRAELASKTKDMLGSRDMIVIPDRGEEQMGYKLAHLLSCEVFEWPEGLFTDYCEFRLQNEARIFKNLLGGYYGD